MSVRCFAVVALAGGLAAGCLSGAGLPARVSTGSASRAPSATAQLGPDTTINVEPAAGLRARWRPPLGVPRPRPAGGLTWAPEEEGVEGEAARVLGALSRFDSVARARGSAPLPATARAESLAAWSSIRSGRLARYAAFRTGAFALALGDTVRALAAWGVATSVSPTTGDPLVDALGPALNPRGWESLERRVALLEASGRPEEANAALEAGAAVTFAKDELGAWLLARAARRVAGGDSAAAIVMDRRVLLGESGPEVRAAALDQLEALRHARHESLLPDEEFAAALLALAPREGPPGLAAAELRLRRVFRRDTTARRLTAGLELAEVLRRRRMHTESLNVIEETLELAVARDDRARCWLERARTERNAGRAPAAYASYQRAAEGAADLEVRDAAWWEIGQEAESQGEAERARAAYRSLVLHSASRREEAVVQGGLSWLITGERDSALAWFERGASEGARFWRAVLLRGRGLASGDSLLHALAREPGYGFYAHAARETLGVRGWPGEVEALPACSDTLLCGPLALARDLAALGAGEDALTVLERWDDAMRAHAERVSGEALAGALLHAARIAYVAGATDAATRFAVRAAWRTETAADAWRTRPWRYPPAHDSLFASLPATMDDDGIERALIQGLAWQESKFAPRARSRSNALGLLQLMIPTAGDVARWLREPKPDEEALFDPALNLRHGVRYMRYLLNRFDGHFAVALAAYNGGPGRIARNWKELYALGGEALLCEVVSVPAANDYAKRVLSLRQAYRELRPTAEWRP